MEKLKKLNLKGHLLTSISYMIPIVCGGGFLVAIGMAMGGTNMYARDVYKRQSEIGKIRREGASDPGGLHERCGYGKYDQP